MSKIGHAPLRSKPLRRVRGGFTLVEVLVAAVVFATVFLTIVTLFSRAATDFSGSRLLTATTLAQAAMEEALKAELLPSARWTVNANRIRWEVQRRVEELPGNLWTIEIIVKRQSDERTYATLRTQAYRPHD